MQETLDPLLEESTLQPNLEITQFFMGSPEGGLSRPEKFARRYEGKVKPAPKKEDIVYAPRKIPEELRLQPRYDEVAVPTAMLATMSDEDLAALHLSRGHVEQGVQIFIAAGEEELKVRSYVFNASSNSLIGHTGYVSASSPSYGFLRDLLQARTKFIQSLREKKKRGSSD